MKQFILFLWAILVAVSSPAQNLVLASEKPKIDTFEILLGNEKYAQSEVVFFKKELEDFEKQVSEKRLKKEDTIKFLEWLNWKLHCTYLVNYTENAYFVQTLRQENYNCVTGTMLWAYLLDRLEIGYQIFETNYHVYLTVHLDGQDLLIESTSPKNGIVWEKEKIALKLQQYKEKYVTNTKKQGKKAKFMQDKPINRSISLVQLSSLQLFNRAVVHYNRLQFEEAIADLQKANRIYTSDRNLELLSLAWQKNQKKQHSLPDK